MRFASALLAGATVAVCLTVYVDGAAAQGRRYRVYRRHAPPPPSFVIRSGPCPVYSPYFTYRAPRPIFVDSYRYRAPVRARQYRNDDDDFFGRTRRRVSRFFEPENPTAGIGASISAWKPDDPSVSDALLRAHLRAYLTRDAAIQGEVGYWHHNFEDVNGSNVALKDIPAGASLLYFLRPGGYGGGFRFGGGSRAGLALYGGIGVDWHNWTEEVRPTPLSPPGTLPSKDTDTVFGYHYLGGIEVGQNTLLRFYVLHIMVFPLVAAVFLAVHFWRIRKDGGISGPL